MALDTNSSRSSQRRPAAADAPSAGVSTRTALLVVLIFTTSIFTAVTLWLVWYQIREQGARQAALELERSIRSFEVAEAERYGSLQRETGLLAELPSLKALLTTNDDRTIQDAGATFWRTSHSSLFALADVNGRVRAIYGPPGIDLAKLSRDLSLALPAEDKRYLVSSGRLFHFASHPVIFGDALRGTQLGMVVNGYQIDEAMLRRLGETSGTEAVFLSGERLIASSRPSRLAAQSMPAISLSVVTAGKQRNSIGRVKDLSKQANAPLSVVFQRSLIPSEQAAQSISRSVVLSGCWAILVGSGLMVLVARQMTKPLEELANHVDAFSAAVGVPPPERRGTREIVQLQKNFHAMELRVSELTRARLESERLATIGSMATSVSHDLRHNLATIYAHAEFLMDTHLLESERAEFFENIQGAVLDTTEMLESLATFSRTGQAGRLSPESIESVLGRALDQVQLHPAAASVTFQGFAPGEHHLVDCDGKQIERALRNLLLNACQARRPQGRASVIETKIWFTDQELFIQVCDNGAGVRPEIQATLFEPFVSADKQDGTGLGLTLARRVAEDHGGSLFLRSTGAEGSVFEMKLRIALAPLHPVHLSEGITA